MLIRAGLVIVFTRIAVIQGFSTFGKARITPFASKAYEVEKCNVAALSMSEDVTHVEKVEDEQMSNTMLESPSDIEDSSVNVNSTESNADDESQNYSQTAYVVNLSYETSNQDIRGHFSQVGEVKKVFVPSDRETGLSKGFAFVMMESEEKRDAAIASLNESELGGRKIYVAKAKPRGNSEEGKSKKEQTKLYVGNISYETSSNDLEEFFSEWGEVSNIFIPTDRDTGLPRGFAFVSMDKEEAENAIESCAEGVELQGRYIEVSISLPKGQKAPPRRKEVKLYVGNLPFDTEIDALDEIFSAYGEIIDIYAPVDRFTDRPRGFAFITMKPEDAEKAIEELDGFELDGRILRVNEAQPKNSFNGNDYNDDSSW